MCAGSNPAEGASGFLKPFAQVAPRIAFPIAPEVGATHSNLMVLRRGLLMRLAQRLNGDVTTAAPNASCPTQSVDVVQVTYAQRFLCLPAR
jgi:hypothetical protein